MTDEIDDDLSAPHRPGDDWLCRDDGLEWPCPIFRRRMWILYPNDPHRLAAFMRHFRDKAAPALPELTAKQVEARFIGWIKDPPTRRRLRAI
ncbi:hypothetical protein [Micromonospora sp. NBC_01796]|uniref:hypothetical protein n=1 Tax=Micromonospora sp. NBC_01796 TaxID=2975987 RepID=UPI002DD97E3B|nr:hypothetical protein [Micromonospora sp. NBC_01796]WSA82843.1 hypothetical protein OIE47_20595 [Micromonospora sp. NBC_01796]